VADIKRNPVGAQGLRLKVTFLTKNLLKSDRNFLKNLLKGERDHWCQLKPKPLLNKDCRMD
jgi:hypothetical protein